MKMHDRVKNTISSLLDVFKSGNMPEKIAIATNPDFDVPSSKWSLNNRIIQLVYGTMDSRGIKQWGKEGRKVKKGSKALYILAPREYESYLCSCGNYLYNKEIEEGHCKKCNKAVDQSEVKGGIHFIGVPVFRVEDTEGKPLPYENIPVPKHNFLDVAKEWNIEVKSSAFLGNVYGCYQRGKKIILASPDEMVFYHELAHAAHHKLGLNREKGQDPSNEIVAEFVAAALCFMEGKTTKLGNSYEYLAHYSELKKLTVEKAVLHLLSEIEKVIKLIVNTESELKNKESEEQCHGMIEATV